MGSNRLQETARAMVAEGKGILAADESTGTITKRFEKLQIASTEESRRDYRELLCSTPGLGEYISGVILYDETIRQSAKDGTPLPKVLENQGILPGIKVDTGAKPLAGTNGEKVTEGLDGLRERLAEYRDMGARFAKWRAVITIGPEIPSMYCVKANAHALARYAALCQEAEIVPIVEPEVLIDGDHTIETSYEVTRLTLKTVFNELFEQRIALDGMVLKPNMVIAGLDCAQQSSVEQVAEQTMKCLKEVVPATVPGVAFLSGGQGNEQATQHLDLMNRMGPHPWRVTFSYARALQGPPMKEWKGERANFEAAQKALLFRARLNSIASRGQYREDMESEAPAA